MLLLWSISSKILIGATCTCLVVFPRVLAWEHLTRTSPDNNHVHVDHGQAHDSNLGYQLVAYIHPEDQASQALESEWLKVQQTTTTPSFKQGRIISIDCTASDHNNFSKTLCQKAGIKSFPTIRLTRSDGSQERYRGPGKTSAILGFLRRSLRPILSVVDEKNLTDFSRSDDVVFVATIAQGDDSDENSTTSTHVEGLFRAAAVRYRDRFAFALDIGVHVASRESSITCWNNPDEVKHETTGSTTRHDLDKFIKLCSTPLIPEMTRGNELTFYETGKSIVHYFTRNEDEREKYVQEMRPLAKKYHEYLHFTTTDVTEYPDAPEMMGLEWGSNSPRGLSVQNPNTGDIYPYPYTRSRSQPVSARAVELFLSDIIQGKVQPFVATSTTSSNSDSAENRRREHEEL